HITPLRVAGDLGSPFHEAVEIALRVRPAGHDVLHPAGSAPAGQQLEQRRALATRPLGHDLDAPVRQVAGIAGQAKRERPAAGPPAESDTLDVAVHPRGQPHRNVSHGSYPAAHTATRCRLHNVQARTSYVATIRRW